MTITRAYKPSNEEPIKADVGSASGQDRTPPVSTRMGKDKVEIDIPALRHLVDTVKDKLKP
jgi:hypothetical protein